MSEVINKASGLDQTFPIPGTNNSSSVFRTNWKAIYDALLQSNNELNMLQNTKIVFGGKGSGQSDLFKNAVLQPNGDYNINVNLALANVLPAVTTVNSTTEDYSLSFDRSGLLTSKTIINRVITWGTNHAANVQIPSIVIQPNSSSTSMGSGSGNIVISSYTFDALGRLSSTSSTPFTYGLFQQTLQSGALLYGNPDDESMALLPPDSLADHELVANGETLSWKVRNSGTLSTIVAGSGISVDYPTTSSARVALNINSLTPGSSPIDDSLFVWYDTVAQSNFKITLVELQQKVNKLVYDPDPTLGANLKTDGKFIVGDMSLTNNTGTDNLTFNDNGMYLNGYKFPTNNGTNRQVLTIASPTELAWEDGGNNFETIEYNLYVSPNGNDTTSEGSYGDPYLTVNRAISDIPLNSSDMYVINLLGRTYDETINLSGLKNVGLKGVSSTSQTIIRGQIILPTGLDSSFKMNDLIVDRSHLPESDTSPSLAINTIYKFSANNCSFISKETGYCVQAIGVLYYAATFNNCYFDGIISNSFDKATIVNQDVLLSAINNEILLSAINDEELLSAISSNLEMSSVLHIFNSDYSGNFRIETNADSITNVVGATNIKSVNHYSGSLYISNVDHVETELHEYEYQNPRYPVWDDSVIPSVPVFELDGSGDPIPVTDDEGNPTTVNLLDQFGNPIPDDANPGEFEQTQYIQEYTPPSVETISEYCGIFSVSNNTDDMLFLKSVNMVDSEAVYSKIYKRGNSKYELIGVNRNSLLDNLEGIRQDFAHFPDNASHSLKATIIGGEIVRDDDLTVVEGICPDIVSNYDLLISSDMVIPININNTGSGYNSIREMNIIFEQDNVGGHDITFSINNGQIIWLTSNVISTFANSVSMYKLIVCTTLNKVLAYRIVEGGGGGAGDATTLQGLTPASFMKYNIAPNLSEYQGSNDLNLVNTTGFFSTNTSTLNDPSLSSDDVVIHAERSNNSGRSLQLITDSSGSIRYRTGVGASGSGRTWDTWNVIWTSKNQNSLLSLANISNGLGFTPANKAGDTFTGNVTISKNAPILKLNNTNTAENNLLIYTTNESNDWIVGSNSRSASGNFFINRYDKLTGDYIDTSFSIDRTTGKVSANGGILLTEASVGPGNGLDADTVDGLHASSFLRSDVFSTNTGGIGIQNGTSQVYMKNLGSNSSTSMIGADATNFYILLSNPSSNIVTDANMLRPLTIRLNDGLLTSNNGQTFYGNTNIHDGLTVHAQTIFNSPVLSNYPVIINSGNGSQLRIRDQGSNKSTFMFLNNGTSFYGLCSDPSDDPNSPFNDLRPLEIVLSSGHLVSQNGQTFNGGTTVNGVLSATQSISVHTLNNQILIKRSGVYGKTLILSNDATTFYMLLSNPSGNVSTDYSNARPFEIRISDGLLTSRNGQYFQGGTNISNDLYVAGTTTFQGNTVYNSGVRIQSVNNQIYMKNSSVSTASRTVMFRNDSTEFYVLISDPSTDINTNFNDLRPFFINLTTGRLTSAQGQTFNGGTSISGPFNTEATNTFNGSTVTNGNVTINNGLNINTSTYLNERLYLVNSTGDASIRITSNTVHNIFQMRNNYGNSSRLSLNIINLNNENDIPTSAIHASNEANGSSTINFFVTPSGVRTGWRGENVLQISTGDITWRGQSLVKNNDVYSYNIKIDTTGQGSSGTGIVASSTNPLHEIWSSPIVIREVNRIGNGYLGSEFSPSLGFYWNGVSASSIKMHSDGSFRFQRDGSSVIYTNTYADNIYASGWFRPITNNGLHWDAYGRGITVADNGATYGNITTTGVGYNGWSGYSIGNWAQFMANGVDCGIHSQQVGDWLLRFDNSKNAYFSANVTAYSDERLKQNKRMIDNVSYRREGMAKAAILYERDNETRLGFGAQTLELTNPEAVRTADDLMNTKSVNYLDLVAVLSVDNSNQQKEIDSLKEENKSLKDLLHYLEERLNKAGI